MWKQLENAILYQAGNRGIRRGVDCGQEPLLSNKRMQVAVVWMQVCPCPIASIKQKTKSSDESGDEKVSKACEQRKGINSHLGTWSSEHTKKAQQAQQAAPRTLREEGETRTGLILRIFSTMCSCSSGSTEKTEKVRFKHKRHFESTRRERGHGHAGHACDTSWGKPQRGENEGSMRLGVFASGMMLDVEQWGDRLK